MLTIHKHPNSDVTVLGIKLVSGATLCQEDVYDSTLGHWESCPTPGMTLGKTPTLWVRKRDLTQDEQDLLGYLASQPKGRFDYIAKVPSFSNQFVLVPGPNYNWDPRILTQTIEHPECIRPLQDIGFLEKKSEDGSEIEFYVLTDLGRDTATGLYQ